MTVPTAKAALRAEALERRAAIDPELRARMAGRLAAVGLELVQASATSLPPVVAAYHPMRGEVDTLGLLEALAAQGIATALPKAGQRATPLHFLAWRPGDALESGRFGVREPSAGAPALVPDVLFVPLAGFDAGGFRLGYGAGYYDATLRALRRDRRVLAIGVAFAAQEVDRVPREPHDERLDAVATEHGLRSFGTG